MFQVALVTFVIFASLWASGMFDWERLAEGIPEIGVVGSEMIPPDFTRWQQWIGPMIDTIAMSIAGTTLAVLFSLPLAFLAAKNQVAAILIVILVAVSIVDVLSGMLRRRFQ